MQEERVETAGPQRRRGGLIVGLVADLRRPGAALGNVLNDGQLHQALGGRGALRGSGQELKNFVDALPFSGADQRDRRAELHGELGGIDFAAAAAEIVGHVEDDQRRQAETEDRRGEDQMAAEIGGIEDQQDGVGLGNIFHFDR